MGKPKLIIGVEPNEGGKALCLSLAPSTEGGDRVIMVVLCLSITNSESTTVEIDGITFSFPGSDADPFVMKGVKSYLVQKRKTAKLAAGERIDWSNGIVPVEGGEELKNMVYRRAPAPPKIKVAVSCDGFAQPAEQTFDLVEWTRPTSAGAFLFPYAARDLRVGEYFVAEAKHWANGGLPGTQIYAHDIGCAGAADDLSPASSLLPGTNGSKNEHWRIWNKPVRAVADGIVESWRDTTDENTVLGSFPEDPPDANYIWIKHEDEYVCYMHLKKGSIPDDVKKPPRARVKAGDIIGRVGNNGNSTNPHTHIECRHGSTGGPLRPLPFRDAWVLRSNFPPHPTPVGPWVKLTADGVSREPVAIWPSAQPPTWYPRGWSEVARSGIPAERYQTICDRAKSSGYRPIWVDAYHRAGDLHFNVIFRPSDGAAWSARHGLTAAEYQAEFDKQKENGRRLLNVTSYPDGEIRYAAIWVESDGPTSRAYHGLSADEHQRRVDTLSKEGFRPVNVSVVSILGVRSYTALWDKADVGKFQLKSFVAPADYQKLWDDNEKHGRKLAYINACQDLDGPHFSVIFEEKPGGQGGTRGRHGMGSNEMQREYDDNREAGRLTWCIAGYDHDGEHCFAAAWRKA